METLKLSIRVFAGRALKNSNRVSFRALKLSKRATESVWNNCLAVIRLVECNCIKGSLQGVAEEIVEVNDDINEIKEVIGDPIQIPSPFWRVLGP